MQIALAKIARLSAVLLSCALLSACPVEGTRSADKKPAPIDPAAVVKNVLVSWTANREHTVNAAGGGYKVHYSKTINFGIPSATFIDVPYVSGSSAPTSVVIPLLSVGTWYIRVVPYSANTAVGTQSAQVTVVVQ